MPNPFLSHQVDDTVTLPPGSVPELHGNVVEQIHSYLAQSRQADRGLGLLVIGQTGSGKSHMIAQLRKQLAEEANVVLVAIRMRGAFPGRFWHHTRKAIVSELLRGYENAAAGANGLLRILRNKFPKWAANISGPSGGLFDWLFGRTGGSTKSDLQPFLDEYHRTCASDDRLDYSTRKVLPKIGDPALSSVAHDWLRGEPLGSDDLQTLGLKPITLSDLEYDDESRRVVTSILKLAGKETTLLLCFDEVETIQSGTFDSAALRQFTTLVTELVVQTGHRLVATFLRTGLHAEIEKAIAESDLRSNLDKIGQFSATIPTLTWEQSVRIVACRLEASKPCREARQGRPGDPFWPLSQQFVESTFKQNKFILTPRHLIRACAVEFDRVVNNVPLAGVPPITPPPTPPVTPKSPTDGAEQSPKLSQPVNHTDQATGDEFQQAWNKRHKKTKPQAVKFDDVMGIALPWLVEATNRPFRRAHDVHPQFGDVNLIFQPTSHQSLSLGVSFCNQEPRSLRWRLERLQKQWADAKGKILGGLVVLRFAEPKVTEAALERITKLKQAGVRTLFLGPQQLTELAAFHELLIAAQTGLLTRCGKAVEVADYSDWAKENLTNAVKDLLRTVFDQPVLASTPPVAPPLDSTTAVKKMTAKHKAKK